MKAFGARTEDDDCTLWEIEDPIHSLVETIVIHYDEWVHGLSIETLAGMQNTLGSFQGQHLKFIFTENAQPVGLYGVKDYEGMIQGLGFYKFICNSDGISETSQEGESSLITETVKH